MTVFEMLQLAEKRLARPVIDYPLDSLNGHIRFSLAAKRIQQNFPNYIYITQWKKNPNGTSNESLYLGKITKEGELVLSKNCPKELGAIVVKVAQEPLEAVKEAGRKTGICCFCGRELTNEISRRIGYGPICAEKYGLPWE